MGEARSSNGKGGHVARQDKTELNDVAGLIFFFKKNNVPRRNLYEDYNIVLLNFIYLRNLCARCQTLVTWFRSPVR